MSALSGKHLVFVVGFIAALIVSIWSEHIAENIIILLFLIGIGIFIKETLF